MEQVQLYPTVFIGYQEITCDLAQPPTVCHNAAMQEVMPVQLLINNNNTNLVK
jgi:hypothetical protein